MAQTVAIIDYGSGNLRSAEKALARAANEAGTGHQIIVTNNPNVIARAERIVLPGVGAFGDCMKGLSSIPGMIAALEDAVLKRKVPFLGICVGMQLLATVGREHGDHKGLGWIKGEVVRLTPTPTFPLSGGGNRVFNSSPSKGEEASAQARAGRGQSLKIPHMGWNELKILKPHPLTDGMAPNAEAYFVHSYHFRAADPAHVLATTDYDGLIAAIVARDNIAGTQFHPEKSQAVGLALLGRFLKWTP